MEHNTIVNVKSNLKDTVETSFLHPYIFSIFKAYSQTTAPPLSSDAFHSFHWTHTSFASIWMQYSFPQQRFSQTSYNTRMPVLSNFILVVPLEMNQTNEVCNLETWSSDSHWQLISHLLIEYHMVQIKRRKLANHMELILTIQQIENKGSSIKHCQILCVCDIQ